MPVETPSIFAQVIEEHLALKERNARLGGSMPIEHYKGDGDPFENHPLFKSEEQARIEETMDGVDPDFSDESLEDVRVVAGRGAARRGDGRDERGDRARRSRNPRSGATAARATSTGAIS